MTLNKLFTKVSRTITGNDSLVDELRKATTPALAARKISFVSFWDATDNVDYNTNYILPLYTLIWRFDSLDGPKWSAYSQNNIIEYKWQFERLRYEGVDVIVRVSKWGKVKVLRAREPQLTN